MVPVKYYHATDPKNVESILREGLRPPEGHSIVYLSEKPGSWKDPTDALLSVDFGGAANLFRLTKASSDLDEVYCWGSIDPFYIDVEYCPGGFSEKQEKT